MSRSSAAISPIVLAPLGPELAARKTELERIVDDGKVSFVAVGHALAELKADPEFYAPQSFENYAVQRFGFKKSRWYQTMAGAVVADIISPEGFHHGGIPVLPDTERTIRPLTRLLPRRTDEVETEQRDRIEAAWARACKLAEEEGATVAGRHVKAAVDELTGKKAKPVLVPRKPLSIDDLSDIFEADDDEFATRWRVMKNDVHRFRDALNATIRKAEQMGIEGRVVMAAEG